MKEKDNKTRVNGEYTDATIFLPREEIEDGAYEQVQQMVDHPAFRNPVRVMPDMHYGSGAVIGFTMPLSGRVCPNTVGVDQGCGMLAVKIEEYSIDITNEESLLDVDATIRDTVPMGRDVHSRNDYHMRDDFPWDEVSAKWESFTRSNLDDFDLGEYDPQTFEYGIDYFKTHCRKIGYNMTRAINSLGSLGGGNHFIELCTDTKDNLWCVVHSGSRGLGAATAEYHQEQAELSQRAREARNTLRELSDEHLDYIKFDVESVSEQDLMEWLQGAKGESFIEYETLKTAYKESEPEKIERIGDALKQAIPDHNGTDNLAYLDGDDSVEYLADLAFTQTYASESRRRMANLVAKALGGNITDKVESVHNYIDYEDGIIRKGATPARDGQRAIVPMNMSDGSYLVEGHGNDEWNQSCPHGAGRRMSRSSAYERLSQSDMKELMQGTVATKLPLDESPAAYKDETLVTSAMKPTATLIEDLTPILSIKSSE